MPSVDAQSRFEALKRQILELGFVRPGSLVRRFMPCGNPACRCMAHPPQLHGPYYQWSYKIARQDSFDTSFRGAGQAMSGVDP